MSNNTATLFFLIDALGWTYIEDKSFLDDFISVRKPIRTVLGYSSGAIPSILTGKLPKDHGQWNLLYYSPDKSPFRWIKPFSKLPSAWLENRWVRRAINVVTRRISNHKGYFSSYGLPTFLLPLFDLVEKKNLYKPGGVPGSVTVFDLWVKNAVDFITYSYHDYNDNEIFEKLKFNLNTGNGTVHFAYLAEVDAFLHKHCKDDKRTAEIISQYEGAIAEVLKIAGKRYEQVHFSIFSDHGMTPVYRTVDLRTVVERSELQLGEDYLAVYDSTIGRFWYQSDKARRELPTILSECRSGHLLRNQELKNLGINFGHNSYGDCIFLLDPGSVIAPNFISSYVPEGMHGYHPDDSFSYGCFFSNVSKYAPRSITDLMDVFLTETSKSS